MNNQKSLVSLARAYRNSRSQAALENLYEALCDAGLKKCAAAHFFVDGKLDHCSQSTRRPCMLVNDLINKQFSSLYYIEWMLNLTRDPHCEFGD